VFQGRLGPTTHVFPAFLWIVVVHLVVFREISCPSLEHTLYGVKILKLTLQLKSLSAGIRCTTLGRQRQDEEKKKKKRQEGK